MPDGEPAGSFKIGGLETGLGWLVLIVVAFTVVSRLRLAAKGTSGVALGAGLGSAGAFVLEMLLRFAGDADRRGNPGPHSYFTGGGLALAQWGAIAVVAWRST